MWNLAPNLFFLVAYLVLAALPSEVYSQEFQKLEGSKVTNDQIFIDAKLKELNDAIEDKENGSWEDGQAIYAPDRSFRIFTFRATFCGGRCFSEYYNLMYFEKEEELVFYEVALGQVISIEFVEPGNSSLFVVHQNNEELERSVGLTGCPGIVLLEFEGAKVALRELFEEGLPTEAQFGRRDKKQAFVCGASEIDVDAYWSYDLEKGRMTYGYPRYFVDEFSEKYKYYLISGVLKWDGEYFRLISEKMEAAYEE